MRAAAARPSWGNAGAARPSNGGIGRAIKYLGMQRRAAIITYTALVIASLAQLAVPQLIQRMINAITQGYVANQILGLPALVRGVAASAAGFTVEQLQDAQTNAESWLVAAALVIVLLAVARAIFSFVQAYMSENISQGIAFTFRNEIFAKIQRLSFSYHDRNQTGQLMIRATDDVERVRLFIAQGLVLTAQAFLLLIATLIILFLTNWQLTLVVLPILPIALVVFMIFGKVSQPLFVEIQMRLSRLNTVLQENMAGIRVVRAFTREKTEQAKFDNAADHLLEQQLKVARTFSFLFPVIFLIAQMGQAALLYFAGRGIVTNQLTLGDYQSFSLYVLYVFFPLGQLGFIISLAQSERIGWSHFRNPLDAPKMMSRISQTPKPCRRFRVMSPSRT
ncbi:MAG: ABC transporter ATP-binding protein [Anaerolineae bacterium]